MSKRICVICKERRAVFFSRGRVKSDRFHNLCPRCFRSLFDKLQVTAKSIFWGGEEI